jgi:HAE1 family hydrophobic/amphiphilic exporter-1
MLSKFFLDRPVFAWVIAIVLMVLGCLSIYNLPISQYPPIAPPSIAITASYPGASAETVENSVTQIIEQKMTGFDDLLYLSSSSDSSGSSRIELTFKAGTDPDLAWAKVQNKLQLAQTSLPSSVQQAGVSVNKSTRNFLLIAGLVSEDGNMDCHDLCDYAQSNLEKVIARIPGVGEVSIFGSQYSMRVWVNPDKLTDYNLTFSDVIQALQNYNVQVSAGQFGGKPTVQGQRLNASIVVQNLLKTPEEFGEVPIRINADGSTVRICDIGRTELGTESYDRESYYKNKPAAGMAIRQAPGANALETANAIKEKLEELSRYFPHGMKVVYPYDTTPFIRVAIKEVVKTLFEAVILVFLVMYLFMGNIRATLIPTIAVPVVLLGTFAALGLFGFSINMLTMFAMVLSIGLLVDDAIVVVENVERIMSEEGLSPREATAKSMEQITSALVGIGLVLSAVFGPMAFFSGSTGIIYRQFSVTVIASMLLSVVVALILTPVLCATFLKPVAKGHEGAENSAFLLRWFFSGFNRFFSWIRERYIGLVGYSLARKFRFVLLYIVLVAAVGYLYMRLPSSYLPNEDQGVIMCQVILPTGSTFEMTKEIVDAACRHFLDSEKEAVESCMSVIGTGFSGQSQNNAMAFIKLKDWELRQRPDLKSDAVIGRAMGKFFTDPAYCNAMVFAFGMPAVSELGNAQGVDFELVDRGSRGHKALMEARNQLIEKAKKDPRLASIRANGLDDVSEYRVDVNWKKGGAQGIPINDIHTTISAAFGSSYVNNFVQNERIKKVFVQADGPYRTSPEDLNKLYVRNNAGKMVPYSSFATGRWSYNSPRLERFNGFASLNIWAEAAAGRSSGEAMQAMEELVPEGFGYDWTGLSYQERMATSQGPLLYAFSILVIFLCVAALYESWTIPFVNLLMLPLGVLGALAATSLRGLSNDVYFQIGFLTTLGLSTKNAILIIQFIKGQQQQGKGLVDATLSAVKIRFRPVIMTSLAFFFGTLPLATATGAGAGAMNAIGTAVTGGMLSATFIDLIFIPLFFVMVCGFFGKRQQQSIPQPVLVSDVAGGG